MQVPFLLSHETDFHFRRRRGVVEVLAVIVATNDFSLNSEWRDGTSQLVDVVRSDCFRIIAQHQRSRQIQTLGGPTRYLVEVMLFFEEGVWRDVFECKTVFPQSIALFVWIDPIARGAQRETAFSQSGDE